MMLQRNHQRFPSSQPWLFPPPVFLVKLFICLLFFFGRVSAQITDQQKYSLAHLQANLLGFRGPCGQFGAVICGVAYPLPTSAFDSVNQHHIRVHLHRSSRLSMEQDQPFSTEDHPSPALQLVSFSQQYPFNTLSIIYAHVIFMLVSGNTLPA